MNFKSKRVLFLCLSLISVGVSATDFNLSSQDVTEGENIQVKFLANDFGCTGDNLQPTLSWSNPPAGTKSYAITFYDKDADTGSG